MKSWKQHMQNSLLLNNSTIGNGCLAETIDFTICFAVHTRNHLPTLYNMCVNIAANNTEILQRKTSSMILRIITSFRGKRQKFPHETQLFMINRRMQSPDFADFLPKIDGVLIKISLFCNIFF